MINFYVNQLYLNSRSPSSTGSVSNGQMGFYSPAAGGYVPISVASVEGFSYLSLIDDDCEADIGEGESQKEVVNESGRGKATKELEIESDSVFETRVQAV